MAALQGDLDSTCGLYAAVHAIDACLPGRSSWARKQSIHKTIVENMPDVGCKAFLLTGTGTNELRSYVIDPAQQAFAKQVTIENKRLPGDAYDIARFDELVARFRNFKGKKSFIIGIDFLDASGDPDSGHWTTLVDVRDSTLFLNDGHMKELKKAYFGDTYTIGQAYFTFVPISTE